MSTASSLQLPLQRRALLTLQLALVLASSLQGTATGPSSEFAAEVESNISALSAECSPRLSPLRAPGTDFHCQLRWGSGGPSKAADAFGIFEDTIAETSWATLRIHGLPRRAESESDGMSDQRMSFAAGFVEGALTVERTWQHRLSYFGLALLHDLLDQAVAFVEANDAYVRERIAANSELEPFWAEVKLVWAQLDGLADTSVAGHLAACKPGRCLDRRSFLLLNAEEDLSNIIHKPFKGALEGWTAEEAAEYTRKTTHCSAIVRLLPGNSDLLLGHNTWTGYYSMLRVLKEIDLPLSGARAAVSVFPGYFGALYSGDDFYALSSGLAVQETTNSVYNSSTLALISPSSVPLLLSGPLQLLRQGGTCMGDSLAAMPGDSAKVVGMCAEMFADWLKIWHTTATSVVATTWLMWELWKRTLRRRSGLLALSRPCGGDARAGALFSSLCLSLGWALRSDRALVLEGVRSNGLALEHAPEPRRADRELVLVAISQNSLALEFAAVDLRADMEVVLEAAKGSIEALNFASETILGDRVFVRRLLRLGCGTLQYASEILRADRDLFLEAVGLWGPEALDFASEALLADPVLFRRVVGQDLGSLRYASQQLLGDLAQMMEFVRLQGLALQYASSSLHAHRGLALEAVRQDGRALQYVSEALRGDLDFMLEVLQNVGSVRWLTLSTVGGEDFSALSFASAALLGERRLVLEAVRRGDDRALSFASAALRADPELVIEAVSRHGPALQHASAELRADLRVVHKAVRQSKVALRFAAQELLHDPELMMA
ncbi:unnamed protein product, partial [Polarella glacialis]